LTLFPGWLIVQSPVKGGGVFGPYERPGILDRDGSESIASAPLWMTGATGPSNEWTEFWNADMS